MNKLTKDLHGQIIMVQFDDLDDPIECVVHHLDNRFCLLQDIKDGYEPNTSDWRGEFGKEHSWTVDDGNVEDLKRNNVISWELPIQEEKEPVYNIC